jgi:predicted phosphodiesterase
MHILFVGDTHGSFWAMKRAFELAEEADADLIISVGDFGFWPKDSSGFCSRLRKLVKKTGRGLWVVDGNHDFPGNGDRNDCGYLAWSTDDPKLGTFCRLNRGARFTFDGHTFAVLGGAVSIDRKRRLLGSSYWIEEMVNDADVEAVVAGGPADVFITHDSIQIPPGFMPGRWADIHLDHDIRIQRERMTTAFEAVDPRLHIHGHWHHRYVSHAPSPSGSHETRTLGLAHDGREGTYALLDCETLRVS